MSTLDEISDGFDLQVTHQAGQKRTLYATRDGRTFHVAEVCLRPRGVTPLTNRLQFAEAIRALEDWADE